MSMQTGAYRDMSVPRPGKNVVLAYVLWFFLGFLGAHRYYVGHVLKGLLFLVGSAIATALSPFDAIGVRIVGFAVGFIVFVFWVIDAFKLPKLVAGTGAEVPSATAE